MRYKINLDTESSVLKLVNVASSIPEPVFLTDADHVFVVSAKSILGVKYGQIEWHDLYIECEKDLFLELNEFLAD